MIMSEDNKEEQMEEIQMRNSGRSDLHIYKDQCGYEQYIRVSELIGMLLDYKDKDLCAQLAEQMLYSEGFVDALCEHLGFGCEADCGTDRAAAALNRLREGVAHNTDQMHKRIVDFYRKVAQRALNNATDANNRVKQLDEAWPKSLEQYKPRAEYTYIGDDELRRIEAQIREEAKA